MKIATAPNRAAEEAKPAAPAAAANATSQNNASYKEEGEGKTAKTEIVSPARRGSAGVGSVPRSSSAAGGGDENRVQVKSVNSVSSTTIGGSPPRSNPSPQAAGVAPGSPQRSAFLDAIKAGHALKKTPSGKEGDSGGGGGGSARSGRAKPPTGMLDGIAMAKAKLKKSTGGVGGGGGGGSAAPQGSSAAGPSSFMEQLKAKQVRDGTPPNCRYFILGGIDFCNGPF